MTDVLYKADRTEKEDEDLPDLNPDSEGDTGDDETAPEGRESFVLEENVIDTILPDMSDDYSNTVCSRRFERWSNFSGIINLILFMRKVLELIFWPLTKY